MAKTLTGVVSSDKGNKTIVVTVATRKTHPLYKKQYTHSKRFMAHDETNDAQEGDKVVIAETKPISARKRFMLVKVVERAPIRHTAEADEAVVEEVLGTKEKVAAIESETKKKPAEAKKAEGDK
jgi:small subunit ribosomal protein S17